MKLVFSRFCIFLVVARCIVFILQTNGNVDGLGRRNDDGKRHATTDKDGEQRRQRTTYGPLQAIGKYERRQVDDNDGEDNDDARPYSAII